MRQIGTLNEERAARRLADYLLTLGVNTSIRPGEDGWGVWVLDEDRIPQARAELESYQQNPDDPRFHAAGRSADAIRREAEKRDAEHRKNTRDVSQTWGRTPFRRRPLTMTLIAISVVVFLLQHIRETRLTVMNELAFTSIVRRPDPQGHRRLDLLGVDDIARGELWRLITPIFLHHDILHIALNMWWLTILGTIIETRRGTATLAVLVLFAAVTSNMGQHIYNLKVYGEPVLFMGMSGVGYALFGYAWVKGHYEPEQGIILHPSTVRIMLFWLILCMTGAVGDIANAAHFVGMVSGILFGLARF